MIVRVFKKMDGQTAFVTGHNCAIVTMGIPGYRGYRRIVTFLIIALYKYSYLLTYLLAYGRRIGTRM